MPQTIKQCIAFGCFGSEYFGGQEERQLKQEALDYHEAKPHGKIKVVPTKPSASPLLMN